MTRESGGTEMSRGNPWASPPPEHLVRNVGAIVPLSDEVTRPADVSHEVVPARPVNTDVHRPEGRLTDHAPSRVGPAAGDSAVRRPSRDTSASATPAAGHTFGSAPATGTTFGAMPANRTPQATVFPARPTGPPTARPVDHLPTAPAPDGQFLPDAASAPRVTATPEARHYAAPAAAASSPGTESYWRPEAPPRRPQPPIDTPPVAPPSADTPRPAERPAPPEPPREAAPTDELEPYKEVRLPRFTEITASPDTQRLVIIGEEADPVADLTLQQFFQDRTGTPGVTRAFTFHFRPDAGLHTPGNLPASLVDTTNLHIMEPTTGSLITPRQMAQVYGGAAVPGRVQESTAARDVLIHIAHQLENAAVRPVSATVLRDALLYLNGGRSDGNHIDVPKDLHRTEREAVNDYDSASGKEANAGVVRTLAQLFNTTIDDSYKEWEETRARNPQHPNAGVHPSGAFMSHISIGVDQADTEVGAFQAEVTARTALYLATRNVNGEPDVVVLRNIELAPLPVVLSIADYCTRRKVKLVMTVGRTNQRDEADLVTLITGSTIAVTSVGSNQASLLSRLLGTAKRATVTGLNVGISTGMGGSNGRGRSLTYREYSHRRAGDQGGTASADHNSTVGDSKGVTIAVGENFFVFPSEIEEQVRRGRLVLFGHSPEGVRVCLGDYSLTNWMSGASEFPRPLAPEEDPAVLVPMADRRIEATRGQVAARVGHDTRRDPRPASHGGYDPALTPPVQHSRAPELPVAPRPVGRSLYDEQRVTMLNVMRAISFGRTEEGHQIGDGRGRVVLSGPLGFARRNLFAARYAREYFDARYGGLIQREYEAYRRKKERDGSGEPLLPYQEFYDAKWRDFEARIQR